MSELPVVVVGAGPVGLAAAAHLLERGLEPLVLEAGPVAGSAVAQWNHVRLFSQWSELVDPAAARLLEPTGWQRPDGEAYPTGKEWAAYFHLSAPFLWAYKKPMNSIKKKITISTRAIHPMLLATTAHG